MTAPLSPFELVGLGLVVSCGAMALVWWLAIRIRNFGIVDVAWSYAFGLLILLFAALGAGAPARKALACCLLGLWSLRLGTYLAKRVAGEHPHEDSRYVRLREEWKERLNFRFFVFFQAQALSVAVLIAPFAWIVSDPAPELRPVELAAGALWLVAILGESLADLQMSRFRHAPGNRGKVCEAGLWRYSRHPNYFFESLVWWSYFLLALGQGPGGAAAIYLPLVMLWLLLRVTGVPMAESGSLRSRGDAYRAYQARTSKFIPWFPKA